MSTDKPSHPSGIAGVHEMLSELNLPESASTRELLHQTAVCVPNEEKYQ
jgi:hypothetical protein